MYQPEKPFWKMNIKELQEHVNKFKPCTKKKRFHYRKRFTIKTKSKKGKRLKIK